MLLFLGQQLLNPPSQGLFQGFLLFGKMIEIQAENRIAGILL